MPRQEIIDALIERKVESAKAEQMAQSALGRPGRALMWLADPTAYDAYLNEISRWQALWGKPLYEKMKAIEPLFGDKTDHIAERERLCDIIELWELLVRDRLVKKAVPAVVGLAIQRAIAEAKEYLDRNVHPKLLVEQILLAIP